SPQSNRVYVQNKKRALKLKPLRHGELMRRLASVLRLKHCARPLKSLRLSGLWPKLHTKKQKKELVFVLTFWLENRLKSRKLASGPLLRPFVVLKRKHAGTPKNKLVPGRQQCYGRLKRMLACAFMKICYDRQKSNHSVSRSRKSCARPLRLKVGRKQV